MAQLSQKQTTHLLKLNWALTRISRNKHITGYTQKFEKYYVKIDLNFRKGNLLRQHIFKEICKGNCHKPSQNILRPFNLLAQFPFTTCITELN